MALSGSRVERMEDVSATGVEEHRVEEHLDDLTDRSDRFRSCSSAGRGR